MNERIDTVIVGGGQAGLAMSYHMRRLAREHVILEQARVAERWRNERWDSLMFQFPSSSIQLPGHAYETNDPNGFAPKNEIVHFLEAYASLIGAPLRCSTRVDAIRQKSASDRLLVETEHETFEAMNVVVATGPFRCRPFRRSAHPCPPRYFRFTHETIATPTNCRLEPHWSSGAGHPACKLPKSCTRPGERSISRWEVITRSPDAIGAEISTGGLMR